MSDEHSSFFVVGMSNTVVAVSADHAVVKIFSSTKISHQ